MNSSEGASVVKTVYSFAINLPCSGLLSFQLLSPIRFRLLNADPSSSSRFFPAASRLRRFLSLSASFDGHGPRFFEVDPELVLACATRRATRRAAIACRAITPTWRAAASKQRGPGSPGGGGGGSSSGRRGADEMAAKCTTTAGGRPAAVLTATAMPLVSLRFRGAVVVSNVQLSHLELERGQVDDQSLTRELLELRLAAHMREQPGAAFTDTVPIAAVRVS